MQIGRLVALIEADTTGLRAGVTDATSMVEGYELTVQRAAGAGSAEFLRAGTAVASVGAAAGQSSGTLGKWSGRLSTAASAATLASSTFSAVGTALRGLRAVQAAGGLARFAASLKTSTGGVRGMLPPTGKLVKLLAAGAAAYGIYRGLTALTGAARTARRAVGGLAREVVTLGPLRRIVGGLSGAFPPLGLAIGGAAGGVAGLAGIGGLAAWGVKLSAQAETARVAFTTLTGSAETARATLDNLSQFAASTPFDTVAVQEAGRKLLAYGRDSKALIGDLSALGDIAAGTGRPLEDLVDIYGRVASTGKVTGDVYTRLLERGIPIGEALASTMGVVETDVQSMISAGKVGFADFQRAIESTTQAGGMFAGGMVAQSKTVAGMWSTLTSNFREGFREAFEGATAAFNLPGLLKEITDYVSAGAAVLKEYAAGWRAAAGEGVQWGGIVTKAVGWVGDALAFGTDVVFYMGAGFLRMAATATDALAFVVRGLDDMALAAVQAANVLPGVEIEYRGFLGRVADDMNETADRQRALAEAMGQMSPGEGVRGFFADLQDAVDAAREAAEGGAEREGMTIGVDADTSAAEDAIDKLGDREVSVGSFERGTQAAFAVISARIRGEADSKAVARNTGKMAGLLATANQKLGEVVQNTRGGNGPELTVGGAV